jgi:2-keto-3-deoxy-L-rhamnonate aldolase RhmA
VPIVKPRGGHRFAEHELLLDLGARELIVPWVETARGRGDRPWHARPAGRHARLAAVRCASAGTRSIAICRRADQRPPDGDPGGAPAD